MCTNSKLRQHKREELELQMNQVHEDSRKDNKRVKFDIREQLDLVEGGHNQRKSFGEPEKGLESKQNDTGNNIPGKRTYNLCKFESRAPLPGKKS